MAKLYFKYGAMGSSKSAQALITQFNYEELGMTVWLIKPSVDDRDGANIIRSRIGLQREAQVIHPEEDIIATFARAGHADVIIADEAQFFSPEQIDQLRTLVDERDMPVICFGLRSDFLTHLFPGSRRLFEVKLPLGRDHKDIIAPGFCDCYQRLEDPGRVLPQRLRGFQAAQRSRPGIAVRRIRHLMLVEDPHHVGLFLILRHLRSARQSAGPSPSRRPASSPRS